MVGNNIFPNNLSSNAALRTDTVAFCYRDQDFNPPAVATPGVLPTGQVVPLNDVTTQGGNPAAPELVAQTATGAANAQPYDLYLIESDISQSAIMATNVNGTNRIDAAPGDPIGINQAINGTGINGSILRKCVGPSDTNCMTYVANLTRFFMVSYKVKPDGTLVRTVYGNNRGAGVGAQIQEQPLAYNIEDLQLQYVLDDGTVTADPVAGPDGIRGTADDDERAVNRIRQIMVMIKVQSTEPDEQTRLPETITLNATFSTRNMEYDAG